MATIEQIIKQMEEEILEDEIRRRPLRMRTTGRRLCKRSGCFCQALPGKKCCLTHCDSINPLTIKEDTHTIDRGLE